MDRGKAFLGAVAVAVLMLTGCGDSGESSPRASDREGIIASALEQAENNRVVGRYDEAIAALLPVIEQFPDEAEPRARLAELYLEKQPPEPGKAARQFAAAAGRGENATFLHLEAARAFMAAGEPARAEEHFVTYLGNQPDDRLAWRSLAEARHRQGKTAAALSAYENAVPLDGPASPADDLALAALLLDSGQYDKAAARYERVIEAEGNSSRGRDARAGLALIAVNQGEFDRAKALFEAAGTRPPDPAGSGDLASAMAEYRAWESREDAAQATESPEETIEDAAAALAAGATADPVREAVDQALPAAAAALASKDATPAGEDGPVIEVTSIEEVPPEDMLPPPAGEATVGTLFYEMRDEGEDSRSVALTNLIEAADQARENRNYPLAIRLYRNALAEAPDDAELWYRLSQSYLGNGEFRPAEMMVLEAQRLEPNDISYKLHQLSVARRLYPDDQLIREIKDAYRQFPDSPEIALTMANAARDIERDARSAVYYYRRFLDLAPPGHPRRSEAQAAIERLLP